MEARVAKSVARVSTFAKISDKDVVVVEDASKTSDFDIEVFSLL
jgi:hypothetical protein